MEDFKFQDEGDKRGIDHLWKKGYCISLPAGKPVSILRRRYDDRFVEVRVYGEDVTKDWWTTVKALEPVP